jgi:four helix bundle protein
LHLLKKGALVGGRKLVDFHELSCWKHSQALAIECYRLAGKFPKYEQYALGAQLRRAASSVPANIAEGFGRMTPRDYLRSLFIARGSLFEAESHLMLAQDVGHLTTEEVAEAVNLRAETGRSLSGLIVAIRGRVSRPRRGPNRT